MNPRVLEMLTAKSRQDLEIEMLEELLTGDVKCESLTHDKGRVKCTGDVAYLLKTCRVTIKVCTAMGEHALHCVNSDRAIHIICRRFVSERWTITPI